MKSLVITRIGNPEIKDPGQLELRDVPVPEPGDEDVLIQVAYACICGSDVHSLKGNLGAFSDRLRGRVPMTMGHEVSGVVVKAGSTAEKMGFTPGDRVTGSAMKYCGTCVFCRTGKENFCQNKKPTMNGMSEYICWHMSQVYKLPPQVDLKQGALTEPVSIAFGAVEMVKVKLGSRVAIFGGGGIGLIALQVARLAGAAQIVVIEPVAAKREMALKLGADIVIVPQEEDIKAISDKLTDKLGFDCIIEASGAVSAATAALDILTPDGDLVYFSMYDPSYTLPLNLFWQEYWQQKHIHGMFNTADIFPRVLAVLGRLNLDMMMQKEYPLLEYEKAFADQLSGNFAKVVLKCN